MKVYINGQGHMTKMAAMAINRSISNILYVKNQHLNRIQVEYLASLEILVFDLDYTGVNSGNCSNHECLAFAASFLKGH